MRLDEISGLTDCSNIDALASAGGAHSAVAMYKLTEEGHVCTCTRIRRSLAPSTSEQHTPQGESGPRGLIPKPKLSCAYLHTGSEEAGSQAVTKYLSSASSSCMTETPLKHPGIPVTALHKWYQQPCRPASLAARLELIQQSSSKHHEQAEGRS